MSRIHFFHCPLTAERTTLPRSESLAGVFGEAGQEGVRLGGLANDYNWQGWYQGINHRKNCRAREDQ